MAFFFSQTTNQAVCHTEEAIKTSAITITWTTKFVAMLWTLGFYNKIHTWGQKNFFCWKRYVTEQVQKKLSWKWKPYLLRLGLIPAKEKQSAWILKMPPYRCCGVTMGILSFSFLFERVSSMRTHFAAVGVDSSYLFFVTWLVIYLQWCWQWTLGWWIRKYAWQHPLRVEGVRYWNVVKW